MRLSHKLSLSTAVAIALVLGIYGYFRVSREITLFETDIKRDHQVLGKALVTAASSVAARGTGEGVERLIEDINEDQSQISIRWDINRSEDPGDSAPSDRFDSTIVVDEETGERFLVT